MHYLVMALPSSLGVSENACVTLPDLTELGIDLLPKKSLMSGDPLDHRKNMVCAISGAI